MQTNMSNPTLTFLEQIRHNLEHIEYNLIYQSIVDMRDKFIPTALIKKGEFIERVRINGQGQVFTKIDEVSYIHDVEVLKNYVDFGRANEPKQAVFYGAVRSPKVELPRAVAYFETSGLLKELDSFDNAEEVFTLSRWRVLEDIEIVEMIFSEEALKVDGYSKLSLDNQIKNYKHLPLSDYYEAQGKFFSNEFARCDIRKNEQFKYKITAAYANHIWRNSHLKGITYPSVQSNYVGQNVALLPEIVDRFLKLEAVGMFKFERKNRENLPIDGFKLATDLGKDCMNFKWFDYVGE